MYFTIVVYSLRRYYFLCSIYLFIYFLSEIKVPSKIPSSAMGFFSTGELLCTDWDLMSFILVMYCTSCTLSTIGQGKPDNCVRIPKSEQIILLHNKELACMSVVQWRQKRGRRRRGRFPLLFPNNFNIFPNST